MTTATTTVEEYQHDYSDFHKDAYGFRPRGPMPQWTVEQWDEEFQMLRAICERNAAEEAASQAIATTEVEATIARLIETGAADRAAALRWLHDAHRTGGDNQFLCYELGLPYGYFK